MAPAAPRGDDGSTGVSAGADTAQFLLLTTPAGFEQFFVTEGTPSDPDADLPPVPGPPPPEAVERLAQPLSHYGVSITGPPPTP